jgi:prepilin-type N-terminal cleavage/methylation domain-containing protein
MKQKGFTLVELLAVIVILAVILVIAVPNIIKVIDKAKYDSYKNSLILILKAAKTQSLIDPTITTMNEAYFSSNNMLNNIDPNIKYIVNITTNSDGTKIYSLTANYGGTDYQTIGSGKWQVTDFTTNAINNSTLSSSDSGSVVSINPNNLIDNGSGEKKDNTNFTNFTYDLNEKINSMGSFSKTSSVYTTITSNNYIPIDTNKTYILSGYFKNNGAAATYFVGFASYDIDKQTILSSHTMFITNSTTTLTQDLKPGDTVVYLNNLSGFSIDSSTSIYKLGLIFWNYKDSTNYQYPIETYSRNSWYNLFLYSSVDKINNTITLKVPWPSSNGTIPAGTAVSQSNVGNTYNFPLISGQTLTTNWQLKKVTISGVTSPWSGNSKFRYGTKYIRFLTLDNYNNTPNTQTWYSALQFVEADKY